MKTHIFNRKKYRITLAPPLDGLCTASQPVAEIFLFANLSTKKGLITAIHEGLHASDWDMDEKKVDRISEEIGTFLWRLGYRTL